MSHEALEADANLRTIQKLLDDAQQREAVILGLRGELMRARAERDEANTRAARYAKQALAMQADVIPYYEALQWLYDDWNGPSTEALTRARMALNSEHPGAALLKELEDARSSITALREALALDQRRLYDVWDCIRRAAEYFPGNPDAAEAILSRILEGV